MARLPESDVRNVWKEQLKEIQAELRRTTETMMTMVSASCQHDETGTPLLPRGSLVTCNDKAYPARLISCKHQQSCDVLTSSCFVTEGCPSSTDCDA